MRFNLKKIVVSVSVPILAGIAAYKLSSIEKNKSYPAEQDSMTSDVVNNSSDVGTTGGN
ncbi:MAG: hypothetical protein K6G28_00305 [Acholeplasmatales bacterium]|nr:hypothetical protein [Acholeplasmatales bacterium]